MRRHPERSEGSGRGQSHDPEFIELINRSWEGYKKTGGTFLEELRETYGLAVKPSRKKPRRAR